MPETKPMLYQTQKHSFLFFTFLFVGFTKGPNSSKDYIYSFKLIGSL